MKQIYGLISLLLFIALLLGGCYSGLEEKDSEDWDYTFSEEGNASNEVDSTDASMISYKPQQLYARAIQRGHPYPAGDDGFYYLTFSSNLIYYMDAECNKTPFCGIGGCEHRDESCPAYHDGLARFVSFDGKYYVQTEHANTVGGSVDIYSVDFTTGERSLLYRKTADENATISVGSLLCTKDVFLVSTVSTNLSDYSTVWTLERIYRADGSHKTLRTLKGSSATRNMGACDAGLIIETINVTEEPTEYDEYMLQHPDATQDEYSEYYFATMKENTKYRLEIIDADGNVLEVLGNSDEGYKSPTDADITWNDYIAYQIGADLYLYDSANGTKTMLKEFEGFFNGISSYDLYDGHIIAIHALDEDAEYNYEVYCYDINTNELYKTKNNDGLPAIYGESDEGFVASDSEGLIYITKENYYLGAFDEATVILEYTN